jgi:hypothetical protein
MAVMCEKNPEHYLYGTSVWRVSGDKKQLQFNSTWLDWIWDGVKRGIEELEGGGARSW